MDGCPDILSIYLSVYLPTYLYIIVSKYIWWIMGRGHIYIYIYMLVATKKNNTYGRDGRHTILRSNSLKKNIKL